MAGVALRMAPDAAPPVTELPVAELPVQTQPVFPAASAASSAAS